MEITILFLLLALVIPAQNDRPDFTGVWKVNEARTMGAAREEMETIEHNDPVFTVTLRMRQLDFRVSTTYVIDGKDRTKGGITSNARWEGRTIIIDRNAASNGITTISHESLTLSEDGKVLRKSVESNWSGRMEKSTLVFDRISATTQMNNFQKGSSVADVKNAWGDPDEVLEDGPNTTFLYFNWQCGMSRVCRRAVTFVNGTVTNIGYR